MTGLSLLRVAIAFVKYVIHVAASNAGHLQQPLLLCSSVARLLSSVIGENQLSDRISRSP